MSFLDRFTRKKTKEQLEKQAEKQKQSPKDLESKKIIKKQKSKETPLRPSFAKGFGRAQQGSAGQAKKPEVEEEKKQIKKIKSKFDVSVNTILIKPLITEKISDGAAMGKYGFMVSRGANKLDVKKAVSNLYGVKVNEVRIINSIGKSVRYGRSLGKRKDWKKAIVSLAPGEKIEVYEGV
jgi:large subunit ribosomal protein L23